MRKRKRKNRIRAAIARTGKNKKQAMNSLKLPFEMDLSGWVADRESIPPDALAGLKTPVTRHVEQIRDWYRHDEKPMFTLPESTADLPEILGLARRIRDHYAHLVVIGTGGSSLGGKMLVEFMRPASDFSSSPAIHFLDNTDPWEVDTLLEALPLERSFFLGISKSGTTVETVTLLGCCLEAVLSRQGRDAVAKNMACITGPDANPLRRLAEEWEMETLEHDPALGGRFSVFSPVGLVPAAVAGMDVGALREGAVLTMRHTLKEVEQSQAACAACLHSLFASAGMDAAVWMIYSDRLRGVGPWIRQIWAESLGKGGKGTAALYARGAVDQHSQLQLYLDGPRTRYITLIHAEMGDTGCRIPDALWRDERLDYLRGRHLGDVFDAQRRATTETFTARQVPLRTLTLEGLNEVTLGALLMQLMLETVLTGLLIDVDPFDQPAVEQGKRLAREYLAAG